MTSLFVPKATSQVAELIAAYPLAWVVSNDGASHAATPLPLLAECDDAGEVVSLFGHFARANPQVSVIEREARASILFQGPDGYVSPNLVSASAWAPTWNYAVLHFRTRIEFVPDENDAALNRLAASLEATEPEPWTTAELGERYDRLKQGIVAFRAIVERVNARFKLGQDERPETFDEIVQGHASPELTSWMMRSRP